MASPLFALRRHRWFQALTAAFDRPVAVRAFGLPFPVTMRLGPNLSLVVASRKAEPRERATFAALLEELQPRCFWDVGANVGLYGFTYLHRFPQRPCIMIEPDPRNTACLRRTIERGGFASAVVVEAAVTDSVGSTAFAIDPLSGATGQIVNGQMPFVQRHHRMTPPTLTVQTSTLDALLERFPAPDLIKIDVEQAELSVLQGASRLLRDIRPVMLIELSGARAAAQLLLAAGYRLFNWRTGEPEPDGAWATLARPSPP